MLSARVRGVGRLVLTFVFFLPSVTPLLLRL